MPICPKCGRYHKKSHHRRHVKSCAGADDSAYWHMIISRGSAEDKKYPNKRKTSDRS